MLTRIKTYFDQWITRRSPVTQEMTLTQRNIYIFLSREGWLYALLIVITFIAGINYANNLVLGLCFYLASVFIITIHFTYAHLSGLHFKIIDVTDAEAGAEVCIHIEVSSSGSKPHRQIRLAFTGGSASIVGQVLAPEIIRFYVPVKQRGQFIVPRLTVSTVYPLGILRAWSYIHFQGKSWIWPQAMPVTLTGEQMVAQSDDTVNHNVQAGQDEFDRLDRYIVGESLARISWVHVAKGQGLLSKRFADPAGQEQLLDYQHMPAATHEAKLSQLSYAVQQLSYANIPFVLRLPQDNNKVNNQLGVGQAHEYASLIRLAKAP